MRKAIAAAKSGKGSREELQAAAREMVRELRGGNGSPEKTLLRIKSLLADAGLKANYSEGDRTPEGDAALYRDLIAWSIRAYYEERTET